MASPTPCRGRDPGRVAGGLCCALGCHVLGCLAILPCLKPFLATIQYVYCDTLLPSNHCPSCCVTIQFLCIKTQSLSPLAFLLQYSPSFISTIQTTVLQHKNPYTSLLKPLSCNTKFFFHNIIWASYWKNSEKKKYIYILIFFNTQINLQKFIFFNFTPYKTLENYFLHLVTE